MYIVYQFCSSLMVSPGFHNLEYVHSDMHPGRCVLEELFHAWVMTVQPQPRPEIAIFSDRIPSHVGVEIPGDDDIGQRRQIIQAFAEFFQSLDS